jgi:hypothetical protein
MQLPSVFIQFVLAKNIHLVLMNPLLVLLAQFRNICDPVVRSDHQHRPVRPDTVHELVGGRRTQNTVLGGALEQCFVLDHHGCTAFVEIDDLMGQGVEALQVGIENASSTVDGVRSVLSFLRSENTA